MLPQIVTKVLVPPLVAIYFMLAGQATHEIKFPVEIDEQGKIHIDFNQGVIVPKTPEEQSKKQPAKKTPKEVKDWLGDSEEKPWLKEFKNSYAVRFPEIPPSDVLDELKENGFKWDYDRQQWWAPKSDPVKDFLDSFEPAL